MKRIVLLLVLLASAFLTILNAQTANWKAAGQTNFPLDVSGQINGYCRIAQLDFHQTDPNKFYAITAEGGLFTSTDAGENWTVAPGTESISSSFASICVDRTNDQILYLGGGDPNYYSSGGGLYKSTDGGQTFTLTSLTNCLVIDILQHPTNASILVAATNKGIYRSTNSGANWTAITATNIPFCDLKQNTAANSLILYAGTNENSPRLYRSTDFGATWTQITSGLVAPSVDIESGCRIAVTPADPNRVYLSNVGGYGMVFKSTDGGLNFTQQKGQVAPYLTFYDNDITSSGQGNYNNTLCVDRNNPDKLWLQSQNTWTSNDAGVTWTMLSKWSVVIHTDHHNLLQSPYDASKLYSCNDGGIWLSLDGGSSWTPKSNGLFAFEVATDAGKSSHTDPNIVSIGTQDNGRLFKNTSGWVTTRGGDDYDRRECDYLPNGGNMYSLDDLTRTSLPLGSSGTYGIPTATIEAMAFNRTNTDLGFMGSAEAYRTNNLSAGTPTWTQIGSINKVIKAMHSCIADANRLYVITSDQKIYVSTNANGGGPTFTSYNLPSASGSVASIAAVANNADIVYISINNKVYRSADGGQNWADVTYNLPNVNHRRILAEDYGGTEELVFIATNSAVYYKKAGQTSWTNYSTNLPTRRTPTDFSMFDDNTSRSKIRYTSYGRAVWETGFDNLRVPKADFVADRTSNLCISNGVVNFTDLSIGGATAWSWTFAGGTPATSTQQNPTVSYSTAGAYDVTLTITTPSGPYTLTKTAYINASGAPIAGGTYNVGVGKDFATLTAAVNYWNTNCINSAVQFNLTDATYPTETFPIAINANNPGSSLLIKPTGNTTITGNSATALIVINGADHVTIDGSNGSTANTICPRSTASRNLTLTNNQNASNTAMIWIQNNGSDGATYNTIKNCILIGFASNTTQFGAGSGSSAISNSSVGVGNHYNAFINNDVRKVQYGLYSGGESVSNKNKGTVINLNVMNSVSPNQIFRSCILVKYEDGITISGNNLGNTSLTNTGSTGSLGIACGAEPSGSFTSFGGSEVTGATITYNVINEIVRASTSGGSATGIFLTSVGSTYSSGPNVIANNFISGIRTTNGTAGHYVSGITVGGGRNSRTKIFNNSINLFGTVSSSVQTFGIMVGGSENSSNVELKDNLIINQFSTANRHYVIGLAYPAPYPRLFSDYNVMYTAGANFAVVGGLANSPAGDRNTFAAWKTETGTDANSKNVLPEFTSNSDLHLNIAGSNNIANVFGYATPLSSVTDDIDCEARHATYPTIGADENCVSPDVPTLTASANPICSGGNTTLSITSGNLNSATDWKWYSGSCGGTLVGTGTSIMVSPAVTTTYYVRGEGRCVTPGTCASITVTIGTAPVFTTCPGNQTANTAVGLCSKAVTYTTALSGQTPITLSYSFTGATTATGSGDGSGSVFGKGVTNVTITASNTCGTNTCSFTVTVNDNEAPAIACPANQSVAATSGLCAATVSYTTPSGTDNCPGANTTQTGGLASGASFPVGVTTNIFSVTDAGGLTSTCAFTVTVNDTQAPSITCPANQSISAASGVCSATATYTAPVGTDNCSGPTTTQTTGLASGASFPVGVTTNTFRVTDAGGLTSTCAFTVTVNDTQAPTITCPANQSVSAASGVCSATVTFTAPVGSDNCSGATTVQTAGLASGASFPVGVTTNTFRVTDASGLTATCTFTITVNDTQAPTITCPANQSVSSTSGVCSATVTYTAPVGTDNCSGSTTTRTGGLASGSSFPVGVTTNTFRVTDAAGLTATCTFTITVNDTQAPTITCPANQSIPAASGVCSATATYTAPVGTDNCSGATTTQTGGLASGATYPVGVTTNTFRVTDAAGLTTTCTFTITVNDTQAPTVACKNASVNLNAGGTATITPSDVYLSGSDNCTTVNLQSVNPSTFGCGNIGTNTVTLTVNDGNSNTATCTASVTVADPLGVCVSNLPPVAVCQNVTVSASASCNATVAASAFNNGSSDPENGPLTFSVSPAGPYNLGSTSVVLTVTDNGGLTATCTAMVTVNDATPPSVTCKSATVNLSAGGSGSITTADVFQSGSDNCGTVNQQSVTPNAFTCSNIGTNTVTLTVNDGHSNTATCTATVTVNDITPPSVTCKSASVNLNAAGSGSITTADVFQSGTDNCGTVNQASVTPNSFTCANLGTNTVTLTVNDGHSNTATCTATVTVNDVTAPSVTCKSATVNLSAAGSGSITTADVFQSGTDNCGTVNQVSVTPNAFTCANIGTNTVTLTVNDGHSNTATCTATVTVNDVTAPTVTCKSATVNLSAAGSGSITTADVFQSGSDNCGTVNQASVTPNSFTCANIGTNTVTLTVNDGHSNTATCTATVTVNDITAPTITCKSATVNLSAAGSGSITTADVFQSGSDNCGTVNQVSVTPNSFTCANIGTNTVTLTANDGHSNTATCTATVTVNDVTGPTVTCKSATVNLSAAGSGSITTGDVFQSGSDNCGTVNQQSVSPSTFTCANIGTNTITLTVNDGHSNTATCTATVTVNDVTAPTATCKPATVNLSAAGSVSITATDVYLSGTDNCGTVNPQSVTPSTFSCANIGTNTVTLTVNDGHSNTATCTATVTVNDVTAPTVICKSATVNLSAAGSVSITTATVFQSGTDNCGTVNQQTVNPSAFTCANIGVNTVTLTVNDGHGNTATCTAAVTVNDNLGPAVTCKAATVNLNVSGTATITTADVFQSATDNCGTVNQQSVNPSTFTCANIGVNTVTLTVNDGHGNTGTCTASVTVADALPPTMLCRNVSLPLDVNGQAVLAVAQVNNNSYDNCTLTTLTLSQTAFTCANVGPNNVILTGVDQSGNSGQCTSIVTVIDPVAPTAKCKDYIADLGLNGSVVVLPASVNNGTTDNCGFTLTLVPNMFNCNNLGVNTVTLRATDAGGNTATCTAKVTVRDISGPTAKCANPTIFLNNLGQATLSVTQVDNGSTDNCGIATRFISKTAFNCSEISGPNPVTLTLRDINGNVSTCLSYVTVKDAIAPTPVCEDVTVQIGPNGYAIVYGSDIAVESTDNCSVTAFSPIAKVYTSASVGLNNLVVAVKDFSNNIATCNSVVTVLPQFNADPNDRNGLNDATPFIFVLYPNPADARVMAAFEMKEEQEFHLRMFDMAGHLVLEREETAAKGENTIAIELGGIPAGVYFVDFESEGAKVQKRLVVQN